LVDGDGNGIDDAVIEIWRADSSGQYAGASRHGWSRIMTDTRGNFQFSTIRPGRVPGAGDELHAPHMSVIIFARGLLKHLTTRLYFPDEPSNVDDPVLALVPGHRRGTLIAKPVSSNMFEWNIVLQGEGETVFFEY
jgi:protocatechuate 3,4-dioxygenase, alpha subunit